MKIKRFLCYLFSLSLTIVSTLFCFSLPTSANEISIEEEEQKVYSQATIEDDFSDSRIMVVLKHDISMELKEYSTEDFSEVGIKSVTDLASATREKATVQLEKINNAFFKRSSLENEEIISYKNYNQVICLELENTGKDKVLEAIDIIKDREDVLYVGPDYPIYIHSLDEYGRSVDNDYQYYAGIRTQYADIIQLPEAWSVSTGSSSIKVGVIDTGIDGTHPELEDRIDVYMSRDLTNRTYETVDEVTDYWGHGTHVAGIIGASGANGESVFGVCWDVTLVSLRVFDESGCGYSYNLGLAINYAESRDIPILNFSGAWTTLNPINFENYFDSNTALRNMIENYSGLFVCSAGNESESNDEFEVYPSNWSLPNLISVGASDLEDTRASFSNYSSTKVDVFAPGDSILSSYPTQQCLEGINRLRGSIHVDNGYHVDDGTSMAAPFVTGVAALMLSNNPNLKAHEIKCLIMRNVDDCGDEFDDDCLSGGRLNAYKALTGAVNHAYTHVNDADGERIVCDYCKHSCDAPVYRNINVARGHTVSCLECDYSYTESHTWFSYQINYKCVYCNAITTTAPGIMSLRKDEQSK